MIILILKKVTVNCPQTLSQEKSYDEHMKYPKKIQILGFRW
jgi:hypothetical protein